MEFRIASIECTTTTLREEGTCELENLRLDRPDRREEDSDDRDIAEFFPEEFLSEGEDDIGVIFRDLCLREPHEDEDGKDEEEGNEKYHRPEGRTSWGHLRISRLFGEIHRDIPSIVEEECDEESLDEGWEFEGKRIEPAPGKCMHRNIWEMIESEHDDESEYECFDHREDDLSIARELDSLHDDSGDDCEEQCRDSHDPMDIIHEGRGEDEEERIRSGDSCRYHEDTAEEEECPSSQESCCSPEYSRHPRKWCSCIGLESIQVDECPGDPEHDESTDEDTGRGEDSCDSDDREGSCFNRIGRCCSCDPHDEGLCRPKCILTKSWSHMREYEDINSDILSKNGGKATKSREKYYLISFLKYIRMCF